MPASFPDLRELSRRYTRYLETLKPDHATEIPLDRMRDREAFLTRLKAAFQGREEVLDSLREQPDSRLAYDPARRRLYRTCAECNGPLEGRGRHRLCSECRAKADRVTKLRYQDKRARERKTRMASPDYLSVEVQHEIAELPGTADQEPDSVDDALVSAPVTERPPAYVAPRRTKTCPECGGSMRASFGLWICRSCSLEMEP